MNHIKTDNRKSVLVALSGGVDSALSAALLQRDGKEVKGLHFVLPTLPAIANGRLSEAQKIAEHLEIPLDILDIKSPFKKKVIDPFIDLYLKGMTPNPCVTCNQLIKFKYLCEYAKKENIDYIATGHYARIKKNRKGQMEIIRGDDPNKEQTYFLHRLNQTHLKKVLFPLGLMTKKEVRQKALALKLSVHSRAGSQEICFIPDNNYRKLVLDQQGHENLPKGNIINTENLILGEHSGIYNYTIGQRHGLGIASSRPYYVKEIRPETSEIVVGRKEDLFSRHVEVNDFNWITDPPQKELRVSAQVRYHHRAAPGRLIPFSPQKIQFIFDEPQWGLTPGQALVCYHEDILLGGGWILK